MRNICFLFLSFFLVSILSCKQNKTTLSVREFSVPIQVRLNKIKFLDQHTGFIIGGVQFSRSTILRTQDGGNSWQEISLPANGEQKELYGLAVSENGLVMAVGFGGSMYVSQDSGKHFQYIQHQSWQELKSCAIKNAATAYVVGGRDFEIGHISEILTNGSGVNNIRDQKKFECSSIHFIDELVAYVSGYGTILKSIDGGLNWTFTSAKNDYFKAMAWENEQEGVAIGYEGSIIKTQNGGKDWATIRNGNSVTKKKLHFLDIAHNGFGTYIAVGEDGCACISNDGGDSWHEIKSFTKHHLRGIAKRDERTFMAVGGEGIAFEILLP